MPDAVNAPLLPPDGESLSRAKSTVRSGLLTIEWGAAVHEFLSAQIGATRDNALDFLSAVGKGYWDDEYPLALPGRPHFGLGLLSRKSRSLDRLTERLIVQTGDLRADAVLSYRDGMLLIQHAWRLRDLDPPCPRDPAGPRKMLPAETNRTVIEFRPEASRRSQRVRENSTAWRDAECGRVLEFVAAPRLPTGTAIANARPLFMRSLTRHLPDHFWMNGLMAICASLLAIVVLVRLAV